MCYTALQNRTLVGHFLFWALKVELSEGVIADRCALLLETFLTYVMHTCLAVKLIAHQFINCSVCGEQQHRALTLQATFVERLHIIADTVKFSKKVLSFRPHQAMKPSSAHRPNARRSYKSYWLPW